MRRVFYNTNSFQINLCEWGNKVPPEVKTQEMFKNSICLNEDDPTPTFLPPDNWCFDCMLSDKPSFMTSDKPSLMPSDKPSLMPSNEPSFMPSDKPSFMPSDKPSFMPSDNSLMSSDRPSL